MIFYRSCCLISVSSSPQHPHHAEHYHPPYYNYQYGVQAYGPGYHGHGDPGPLHWEHREHRDGYETKVGGERRAGGAGGLRKI